MDSGNFGENNAKQVLDLLQDFNQFLAVFKFEKTGALTKEQEELIKKREALRAEKKWEEADKIRQEFAEQGILIDDTSQGTKWRKK